ncbi:MAG: four-carbon acid sugar kinase family protein [Microcella sp.]|uniref:four-carbon acid sugar kinase family protein n=1 Tax=Microcella sp. TaxID=1913979 RepID=UPI0024C7F150|nr:four-carbon acid sugar kinase family protein [Microcella sp.]UYN83165.1 MAG: four-carbon acid sugar kinase family protein [Microcella sp.]
MPESTVAYYGDDLTGSVDVLLQFALEGWTGRLFVGRPDADRLRAAAEAVDVVGIAGIARSLPTERLDDEVRPALTALRELEPAIVQYKACSTADSSPEIGSLGRVAEIAGSVFGGDAVPALFAQPDFGRYTVFGHHFAAEAGRVYRLDRQPTMSTHPSTPMNESDLTVHLAHQTALPVESISVTEIGDSRAFAERLTREHSVLVIDAVTDEHLLLIGDALWRRAELSSPLFVIGSGGLSSALARSRSRLASTSPPLGALPDGDGPVLVVSGSRSPRTREQVEHARDAGWSILTLETHAAEATALSARVIAELTAGRDVVVSAEGARLDLETGVPPLEQIAEASARIVRDAVHATATRRVIVCGGDTSGRVTAGLGIASLRIGANPIGNVVVCIAEAEASPVDGLQLLLKGGQVGPVDLFTRIKHLDAP